MVDISIAYEGELLCIATHGPSGTSITTDAPVDNQGRGSSFSPTDLVATGLGTCMITTMAIVARKSGRDLRGVQVHTKKHMTAELPRRIRRLAVTIQVPPSVAAQFNSEERAALERAAHTCPVRISLLDAIEVPVELLWQ